MMPHEQIGMPLPTGEGLIDNIVRFSNLLRDNDVAVSLPAVLDTLKGLPLIDISILQQFKCLLQVNLICRKQDIAKFNKLYDAYWLSQNRAVGEIQSEEVITPAEVLKDAVPGNSETSDDTQSPQQREPTSAQEWTLRYSPESLRKVVDRDQLRFVESGALYEAICNLLKPLNNRLSRRFRYTVHGKDISLRRILRRNMQFGGELIFLDFKKKKIKKRRVIFICDVSGSMDIYTRMILQFIHALFRVDRRTEVFFFATELTRATFQFNVSDYNSAISQIPGLILDWGGGTRIGHCLRIFNKGYGGRLLSTKDIVIIFSDGWDRGEIDVLETQMAILKRKAYKIIWLNPLLGTADYQPICQGMRTALPYVDSFLPMDNPRDLYFLGRKLDKMIA